MPSTPRRTIGLLGGSFNPAHGGHLHISLLALKKLGLHEVWWLVSPHNPLKEKSALAPFAARVASAKAMAQHPRIKVSDFEQRAFAGQRGAYYSWRSIALLQRRYPQVQFVWLMGADNLAGFHRWRRWRWIASRLPIIVFDRAPFSHQSLRSKAARALGAFRMKNSEIGFSGPPPRWAMLQLRRSGESATLIRKKLGKTAFLGHNKK